MESDRPGELVAMHLRFFGQVCRTISHEMNNVCAILGELVGLMEDRLEAAAAADTRKTATTLQRMQAQLERGGRLMTLLNRLGHSVDDFVEKIDAADACEMAAALCSRDADMARCSLEVDSSGVAGFHVSGSRFVVLHVLFRAIRAALAAAGEGAAVRMVASAEGQRCRFDLNSERGAGGEEERMLERLVGACGGTMDEARLAFTLPGKLGFPLD